MFKNLVISGASMRCITLLGALLHLCEHYQIHETVVCCIGSSAGSLLSFLVCCGLQPLRIKQIVYDAVMAYSAKHVNIDCILNMYNSVGIDDGKLLEFIIQKVMLQRLIIM